MYSYSHSNLSVIQKHYSPSGSVYVYPTQTIQMLKHVKDTPDAVRRVKPKDLFSNGTSRSAYMRFYNGHGECIIQKGSYDYDVYYGESIHRLIDMSPSSSVSPSWTSLENKVRSKLRSDYMNLAQSMAEYRQTADLFGDIVTAFIKIHKAYVKRDPRLLLPRGKWNKSTSSNWLKYQYGVLPLMSDMKGAVDVLYARTTRPLYVHGRVSSKTTAIKEQEVNVSYLGTKVGTAYKYSQSLASQHIKYRAQFDVSHIGSTLSRLGLTNPALLAWELIPFSFVADWFVNIGDCLQSLDNSFQISGLTVIKSMKVRSSVIASRKTGTWSGSGTYDEIVYSRTSPTALSLIVRPQFDPSLSLTRIANSLALLVQLRKG